ncbi:MAG: heavy-metal-associated domain-containing protein [Desulfarculaceae bacterium]|nr:heavy-metal-associated domain-containing protein [Desulfarculaceae bacterium]MCF8071437.1 heavy-metal-associated domain-containing protein [Desulfarculaceae bacterium]MCF8103435.1 heavy-metal-associated domain-containing protein [Desulfarculaceae bacterium]MCF8117824.1 heavy-metal-associated domain-containing protein [Desulfarculaceae bacterium]
MESKTVKIPDMSCGHCLATIKREAGEIAGVSSVEGDVESKDVTIAWDAPASWDQIEAQLKDAGYPPK